MMKALEISVKLRNRLTQFRESDLFLNSKFFQRDNRAMEIALNLVELACENDRKIDPCNKIWFEGVYLIDHSFNGEWSDISDLYAALVDEVNRLKLFEEPV